MDIKMGTRTYLEDELEKAREKPKLRKVREQTTQEMKLFKILVCVIKCLRMAS